ncbi:MAG TPA: TIGR02452 family protein [Kofleriaceae bacterium]|nr:TIGR02452 family protein [Kofleriaceae bacterium]
MTTRISKFLSLVLRHDPARIGITLDSAGWTDVDALLAASAAHGVRITRDALLDIVRSSDKQRFALSEDATRIRANQGHSVDVDLELPPATPPERLFHGTVDAALAGIRAQGLVRGARHHVHLSADRETATKVGSRRGAPVILEIRARAMADAGHVFYRSENGVWLVDHVPVEFIELPADLAVPPRERNHSNTKAAIAKQTLAAIEAGAYTNARGEAIALREGIANAVERTVLYELGDGLRRGVPGARTAITVTDETTLEAIARLAAVRDAGGLGVLNFASAKNPGGGFLRGAQAQEETLARSSALYPCLLAQPDYYARNRAERSAIYLDLAIYSPDVPFFRDDTGGWLDEPALASVITCPAPNAGALRQHQRFDGAAVERALRKRAAFVLAIAAHHELDRLVLGAWGAGVFGNDPVMVATAFGELLEGTYANVFSEIVFAVPGAGDPNHDAFAARFARR